MNTNIKITVAAGTIALIMATCDPKAARDLAKAAFLDPEPSLSKPDFRKPGAEGVIYSPEGTPSIRIRRER